MPIAIDIGTRNLHIVSGRASGGRISVDQMVMDVLPSGLVQDGIIREFSGLETAMRNSLDKFKIKEKNCIITINGTHIYTREIDVPKAAPKIMANVVAFEVQNASNSNKDLNVEYVVTKQAIADKPNMVRVRASAIQTDHILEYGKLLANLKLKPLAMDIHPNAISKLVNQHEINNDATKNNNVMLLDIGCVSSTAYVISNGEIAYTRIIPVGAVDIERYCVNHNASEKPEKHIALDGINLSLGYLRMNQGLGDAVRPLVISLTDGVNRIQQYLSGRIQGNPLNKIYIYGRGAMFEGIEETLTESMRLKVERVRSLSAVSSPNNGEIAPFLNAIGALIRM